MDDAKCPSCKFEVSIFLDNCRHARRSAGLSSSANEAAIQAEMKALKKTPILGCGIAASIILAIVIAFIPYIGGILALMVLIGGVIASIQATFQKYNPASLRQQAEQNLANAFSAECPKCHHTFHHLKFTEGGTCCPNCQNILYEQNGDVFWIPNRAVAVSKDLNHFFTFNVEG